MSPLLSVEDLTVSFRRGFVAVDQVSLTVGRSETVGLVGESGSGKTTVGRAVLGLVKPAGGRIVYDGPGARRIQMVFQDAGGSLNPARSVGFSIGEPLRVAGVGPSADVPVGELLEAVGLPGDAAVRYPHEFSGGQRQRIAIARALAASPALIVCDEPTSSLDLSTQAQMLNLLADLRESRGLSYLFISHDLAVVRRMADRVVVLYRGRVMESGPAEVVSVRPLHPYSQALRAAAPVADVAAQRVRREERVRLRPAAAGGLPPAGGPASGASADSCPYAGRCVSAAPVCFSRRPRSVVAGAVLLACHLYDETSGHPSAVKPGEDNA
jgi:ABC-type oligopeptide transport system ATPase subunit